METSQQPVGPGLKSKVTALAVAISMVPILVVGTATYYFGNQVIESQALQAPREGISDLAEEEFAKQKQQLTALSIATGAVALLMGLLALLWIRGTIQTLTAGASLDSEASQKRRSENSKRLTDTITQIRSSLKRDEVLITSVEETRKILDVDRVVVYSVEADSKGVVIAESVESGWRETLGLTINDPCFDAHYTAKYQSGRVKALDDIYESGMTPCYIEQLEKLQVQANLAAPLLHEGKLLGLLVAHQCSDTRSWQESEIDLFAQIATQVGFALENATLSTDRTQLQAQAETEAWWTDLYMDISRRIYQAQTTEEILDAATKQARRSMGADRVVVYSVDENEKGIIIAESVEPGWPRALGDLIEDPCFDLEYIEKYRDGRVRATDDIYKAGLSDCYIEQLAVLDVKANLVAPIIHDGKLLGLLVAHQCSGPRAWKQTEIRWFSQVALQVGFALDNVKLTSDYDKVQEQIDSDARLGELFKKVAHEIHQYLNDEEIFKVAVEKARRVLGCDRVVVYSLDRESHGLIISESVGSRWTRALGTVIEDPCFESRYMAMYEDGRVRALENIHEAGMTPCYIEQLEKLQVKANLVAPILHEGKILGLFVAHQCSEPRAWSQPEIQWFSQIAAQVGFALDNAKLVDLVGQLTNGNGSQIVSLEKLQEQGQFKTWLQEMEQQSHQTSETVQAGNDFVDRIILDMASVQTVCQEAVSKVQGLKQSSPALLQVVNFINKVSANMNQQAMNITIQAGQQEGALDHASIVGMAETVCSSSEQLSSAAAELEALIGDFDKDTTGAASLMETGTEQIASGAELLAETRQQFEQLRAENASMK
ncbi:MAG: GAF domain-containing protein, partial [Cyanobacteria bacterium P01_A01_bin.17]